VPDLASVVSLSLSNTTNYKQRLFLLFPVEYCWLRWCWLHFDYSELLHIAYSHTIYPSRFFL